MRQHVANILLRSYAMHAADRAACTVSIVQFSLPAEYARQCKRCSHFRPAELSYAVLPTLKSKADAKPADGQEQRGRCGPLRASRCCKRSAATRAWRGRRSSRAPPRTSPRRASSAAGRCLRSGRAASRRARYDCCGPAYLDCKTCWLATARVPRRLQLQKAKVTSEVIGSSVSIIPAAKNKPCNEVIHPCLQEAADLFRWSSRVNPSDDRTWMNWALMERRRGRSTPARRLFRSAVRSIPSAVGWLPGLALSGVSEHSIWPYVESVQCLYV